MASYPLISNPARIVPFFKKIQTMGKPAKVSEVWLKGIGFDNSNDKRIVSVLQALGFVGSDGVPTGRWQQYLISSQSAKAMAAGVLEAYASLFDTYPNATELSDAELLQHLQGSTDWARRTAGLGLRTFKALLELSDSNALRRSPTESDADAGVLPGAGTRSTDDRPQRAWAGAPDLALPITMNIQIVIPSDASAERYDMIFSSLRKFLVDHGEKDTSA